MHLNRKSTTHGAGRSLVLRGKNLWHVNTFAKDAENVELSKTLRKVHGHVVAADNLDAAVDGYREVVQLEEDFDLTALGDVIEFRAAVVA
jgi:hypothetical protein